MPQLSASVGFEKSEFLNQRKVLIRWLAVCLVVGVGAVLAGYWAYERARQVEQSRVEMGIMAKTKTERLQEWIGVRTAGVNSQIEFLSEAGVLASWSAAGQPHDFAPLIDVLTKVRSIGNYTDVQLWDPASGAEVCLWGTKLHDSALREAWDKVGASTESVVGNFIVGQEQSIRVPFYARIRKEPGVDAWLLFVGLVDPGGIIFPTLGDWVHPSETGEFLLVNLAGAEVQVVNPSRQSVMATMTLDQEERPAVMAVKGVTGSVEGIDYRGQEVLAYVDRIGNSPWWLVAKKDREEVLGMAHSRVGVVALLLAGLLLFLAILLQVLFWRAARTRFSERLDQTKKAERRFRDAILGAPIPTMMVAEDGEIVEINAAWERLSGHAAADLKHLDDWIDRAFPDQGSEARKHSQGIFSVESAGSADFGCELCTPSGEKRYWSCRSAVTGELPDGRRVVTVFAMDLTASNLAEQKSHDTAEMVKAMFLHARAGLISYAADGRMMMVNPAAAKIVGGTVEEMLTANFTESENWRESGLLDAAQKALRENITVEVDVEIETVSGKKVALVGSFAPIKQGEDRWLFFAFSDELEKRQKDLELQRLLQQQKSFNATLAGEVAMHQRTISKHQLLQQALEAVPSGVVITTPLGIVEWANPAAATLTGYALSELVGQPTKILKSGRHEDKFYHKLWETISNGQAWTGELQNRRKDGSLYWESMVIAPVLSDSNSITHYVAIKRDISEHRKLEEQFQRSQRMESIGMLAGGLSHDLNNVLSPIMMGLELFRMRSTDPKEIARLDMLLKSTERGAGIVRQMLSFARGVDGERAPLDPMRLVKEVSSFLHETIPPSIELTTDVPEVVGMVMADITQMHQVMVNLAVNARDSMPDGGELKILVEEVRISDPLVTLSGLILAEGDYVVFVVRDTGTGISPESLERIFDPFFTTKPRGRGTGLGLSSVHGIVRGHEGAIDVSSELGVGTQFRVYLPRCDRNDGVSPFPEVEKVVEGKQRKVLLVDDEDSVRMVIAMTLEDCGFEVEQAADGQIAKEMFNRNPDAYAAVILDYMMPNANGTEVAQLMKETRPELPIILSSGVLSEKESPDESYEAYRKLGDVVMKKPFSATRLIAVMHDLLDRPDPA